MALTKISTGGVKDDAVSADKLAKPIDLADNEQIRLGTGNDLQLWHDGTNSRIAGSTGATLLYSTNDDVYIEGADDVFIQVQGGETALRAFGNGSVELYYDNSLKARTMSWGWEVFGNIHADDDYKLNLGTGNDLQLYHDGTDSYIKNITTGSNLQITSANEVQVKVNSTENAIECNANGSVDLFYDNSKKLETTSSGVTVTGTVASGDLTITSTAPFINFIDTDHDDDFNIQVSGGLFSINSTTDSATRLQIDSSGNSVFSGTVSDSKGNLRSIPQNVQGSAYTLVAADAGKHILASGNITINQNVHATGDAITIINNTSGDITITQGSSLNLYNTADASTGNRTLASRGMATVLFTGTAYAYISGAGLS